MSLFLEKIEVWNERRIEKRRLKKDFKMTKDGFLYKGIQSQFRDDWEPLTRQIVVGASAFTKNFVNIGALWLLRLPCWQAWHEHYGL